MVARVITGTFAALATILAAALITLGAIPLVVLWLSALGARELQHTNLSLALRGIGTAYIAAGRIFPNSQR